jgi:hypothetical protein
MEMLIKVWELGMDMNMSSDKQLILIILVGVVILIYQYIKDEKKKHDEKLQRHLSKYFDSKW